MFEKRHQPLLPSSAFLRRIAAFALAASLAVFAALAIGVVGYHWIGELGWVDAILNASMILTGMGPVDPLRTAAGKLFASAYALFSGLVFLTGSGIMLAPFAHRVLHAFHLPDEQPAD